MPAKNIRFKPWPHKLNGHWVWGSVEYDYAEGRRPSNRQKALVSVAPRFTDVFVNLVSIGILYLLDDTFRLAHPYLTLSIIFIAVGGVIDFANSLSRKSKSADMVKYYKARHFSKKQIVLFETAAIAYLLSVLALILLI